MSIKNPALVFPSIKNIVKHAWRFLAVLGGISFLILIRPAVLARLMDTNPTEGSMGWYIIEILLFCLLMLLLVGLLAFILFVLLFRKSAFVSGLFKKTMPYYAVLVNVVLALYMLLLLALHRFVELSVWLLFLSQPIVSSFKFFEAPFCFFGHEWTRDNTCLNCNAVRENVS